MREEDALLLAQLADKCAQAQREDAPAHSRFLDLAARTLAQQQYAKHKELQLLFFGGYADAERAAGFFVPRFLALEDVDALREYYGADFPIMLLKIQKDAFAELTHRDYLGAVMALGVKRGMLGDILVREDGADMFVLREVAAYLTQNLTQAGRATLKTAAQPLEGLALPEQKTLDKFVTVASLRLDGVLSEAFALSRSAAVCRIQAGAVYVNDRQELKPDKRIVPGDKLVLRGKGKAVLQEASGQSKKGREKLVIRVFL